MPHKPKQGCAYPNCPKLTNWRYCEEHQRLIAKQYNRFTRAVDVNKKYGKAWKKFVTAMCRHIRCVSSASNRENNTCRGGSPYHPALKRRYT